MASTPRLLAAGPAYESPAKVFSRLKLKVLMEKMRAEEATGLQSPRGAEKPRTPCKRHSAENFSFGIGELTGIGGGFLPGSGRTPTAKKSEEPAAELRPQRHDHRVRGTRDPGGRRPHGDVLGAGRFPPEDPPSADTPVLKVCGGTKGPSGPPWEEEISGFPGDLTHIVSVEEPVPSLPARRGRKHPASAARAGDLEPARTTGCSISEGWMDADHREEGPGRGKHQRLDRLINITRDIQDSSHVWRSREPSCSRDAHGTGVPEAGLPGGPSEDAAAEVRCQAELGEDVSPPPAMPQLVLLEDPIVLRSPQISIPKRQALLKHSWPQQKIYPGEGVVYLNRWFLRRNTQGLFVEGFRKDINMSWNSNIIVERVSGSVLKTVSSRVYILIGRMKLEVNSEFPRWLLKLFENGFPSNWKELYEEFLSKKRDPSRRADTSRNTRARRMPKALDPKAPAKGEKKTPVRTEEPCSAAAKVSRSGRIIKPPLEYWKGGRVLVDALMNVTIFECYDTSTCSPQTPMRRSSRLKLASRSDIAGSENSSTIGSTEPPAPLKKVKAPLGKHNPAKVKGERKTAESPEEPAGCAAKRPRRTRLSPPDGGLKVDMQLQISSKNTSVWRSGKKTDNPQRPLPSLAGRKRPGAHSLEDSENISQSCSSDAELTIKRKVGRRRAQRNSGEESLEERRKTQRLPKSRGAAQTKKCRRDEAPQPRKPAVRSKQPLKSSEADRIMSPQEHDEDPWTETELLKLKRAVSSYPVYVPGYWTRVASMVGTRSPEECQRQHTSCKNSQTLNRKTGGAKKKQAAAPQKAAPDIPVISARIGTLGRMKQVRRFLEVMPKGDVDDAFNSTMMKRRQFEIPSVSSAEDFRLTDVEPVTPRQAVFPEVKTPQCLHISPQMMGSPNRTTADRYVFQVQKKTKRCKGKASRQAPAKKVAPKSLNQRAVKQCTEPENGDDFIVWEMFPDNAAEELDSGEEKDFYFSDGD